MRGQTNGSWGLGRGGGKEMGVGAGRDGVNGERGYSNLLK